MTYKTIFSGRLSFGSSRSYHKVLQFFEQRVVNFYRDDILLRMEDIFVEEDYALYIPRTIIQSNTKSWKNTVKLLEYIAQFAVAGEVNSWQTDSGQILEHVVIEPRGDKAAVQAYLEGRELLQEAGRETEAMEALNLAIKKFDRHSQAYERRGYINYQLHNYEDALYDYTKSIDFSPERADPYLGRAFVHMAVGNRPEAILDLEKAIKAAMPLEPVYWKARRLKGQCHLQANDYKAAIFELRLFTKRQFTPDNPNYKWRSQVFFDYGKALLGEGQYQEAIKAFDEALRIQEASGESAGKTHRQEQLLYRGIALQKAGREGFENDWRAAAKEGSARAAELLSELV